MLFTQNLAIRKLTYEELAQVNLNYYPYEKNLRSANINLQGEKLIY
jgi:hypothetical protein